MANLRAPFWIAVISLLAVPGFTIFDPKFPTWALGALCLLAVASFTANVIVLRTEHPVLKIGGLTWTKDDFCRGWLITGRTGTGKTTAAINQMLWQVTKNCPKWGGVCVDDKGLYWETLSTMFRKLGREQDLILLQVRPEGSGPEWKPQHTFNFLDEPRLHDSAKAKIICDVAGSLGQRSEQSFFKLQAQIQMEFAFKALRCAGFSVTLANAYEFLTSDALFDDVMDFVAKSGTEEAQDLIDHSQAQLRSQPTEQLGGVKTTIANYLKYFTAPDIAAVFCPKQASFRFSDIDRGKVVCISIPQRYQVERRYINTLLKLAYYAHALTRFDKADDQRAGENLLILWADEAQRIITSASDGMSDHNVVDVIREARATVVAATQSYTSLIPPMGDEQKAKVLIANLANRITFCAADEDSAKIAADTLGKYEGKRQTVGYSGGHRTTSWTPEHRHYVAPHEFRRLPKFHAVVQHSEGQFKRLKMRPTAPDGRVPSWY
jgi:hypothetical protein